MTAAQRVERTRFAQVPGWVVDDERIKPAVMDTYLRMALHLANYTDRALSADRRELSALTGRGKSQVNDHLAALRAVGAVVDRGDTLFLPMERPEIPVVTPTGNPGHGDRKSRPDRPGEPVATSSTDVGEELREGAGTPSGLPAVTEGSPHLADAIALCTTMADQLTARGYRVPVQPSARWTIDMEQLLRLDGRGVDDVRRVLGWLDRGADDVASFWRTNVRSPATLRAKWTVMAEQYTARGRARAPRTGAQTIVDRLADRFPAGQPADSRRRGVASAPDPRQGADH